MGIAKLVTKAMMELEGLSLEEAASKIWLNDIDGLLTVVSDAP